MGRRRLSLPEAAVGGAIPEQFPPHLQWPFGRLDSLLNRDDLRESAYEVFFTACRSTSSAGGRLTCTVAAAGEGQGQGSNKTPTTSAKNMAVTSHLKRALGLRARKMRPPMVGTRPMTSAEIMRRQMGVTEQTDGRVRKTLVRCLVGSQMPKKKVESLVLPLELLRHLKSSEFVDIGEYQLWQIRQLKLLDAGLVSHPFMPLDRMSNNHHVAASSLREMIKSCIELQQTRPPLDVRALSAAVMALAWRSDSDEFCHWADGYPLNVHMYLSLLRAIFDLRDETTVLDEVDELLELIKKTWNTLGLNRMIHNICFTWVLFERYLVTGQMEPDLLSATLSMLDQHVSDDAKKAEREPGYTRVLSATLASMYSWAETKLLNYHEPAAFDKVSMKNVMALAISAAEMLSLYTPATTTPATTGGSSFHAADLIERYIKSSVRRAFAKIGESAGNVSGKRSMDSSMMVEVEEDPSEALIYVAVQTKEIVRVEKDMYGPTLRQWHPDPTAIAAATLHSCFSVYVKGQYISKIKIKMSSLSSESMRALRAASELDKYLVQLAVDGDVRVVKKVKQMMTTPYDVESIIFGLVKGWIDERLRMGAECVKRARESESWNPRSKNEPYAQSAVDLMKLAKATVNELIEIQQRSSSCGEMREEELLLRHHLADGIDRLVHQYVSLVASSCGGSGTKESYIPRLPPLTRCNQDSMFLQLWKKDLLVNNLNCVGVGVGGDTSCITTTSKPSPSRLQVAPRPTTSRVTQRLYVRLNTLHYMLTVLHSIDRSHLSSLEEQGQGQGHMSRHARNSSSFDRAYSSINAAVSHVSELSAYRLVFLDSAHYFHQVLYQGGVTGARIRPTLRVMKQNLAFLASVLIDRARPQAVREVMTACVEAFLIVLLAGGSGRAFSRQDYGFVAEDFARLKRLLCSCCGEGLVVDDMVAVAEGVLALMALSTEKLIDEFRRSCCSSTRTPEDPFLPPATRCWSQSDPNTILRVLCHRDDEAASRFLKKTYDLPKRR